MTGCVGVIEVTLSHRFSLTNSVAYAYFYVPCTTKAVEHGDTGRHYMPMLRCVRRKQQLPA